MIQFKVTLPGGTAQTIEADTWSQEEAGWVVFKRGTKVVAKVAADSFSYLPQQTAEWSEKGYRELQDLSRIREGMRAPDLEHPQ